MISKCNTIIYFLCDKSILSSTAHVKWDDRLSSSQGRRQADVNDVVVWFSGYTGSSAHKRMHMLTQGATDTCLTELQGSAVESVQSVNQAARGLNVYANKLLTRFG
ncbi:hypothetical protein B6S09_00805 [Oceanimonas baumannii]|uniref:Uncharacterized protein n=1 Tax=Oceanimonas baumannii TaxID=129578 RepID=A0A235CP50_9GAMM|nr:hypothetical protein B6S09_00805 [Oceanimonas baumannii]